MQPGETIVRRFLIEREVGAGGMGTVYLAKDLESGDPVAVKRLDIRAKNDAERFSREAIVLAELTHPAIVRYVAHGETESGERFIAMEWLDGKTLSDRLVEGPLSMMEAVQLGIRVCSALWEAHTRGIIHRDLKPPNLFLVDGEIGRVKLLDFGVARVTGGGSSVSTMTRTGALIGTPAYMAPEQARGEKELDARADLFSLGSVLFQCLTGKPPFAGANIMAVLAKILLEEAPRVRELRPETPKALDQLIADLLAKNPSDRPPNAKEVARALESLPFGELQGGAQVSTVRDQEAPTKPPSLGDSEKRIICVVLTGDMEGTGDTWTPERVVHTKGDIESLVEEHGGRLDPLLDGSNLIHFAGDGTAVDLAGSAARCSLALRAMYGDSPVVMATGRGEVSRRMPIGEVIDRAARTLEAASPAFVRIDGVSASLLELRFEVGSDPSGWYLIGEKQKIGAGRTLLGKPTQCVGRDREIATMEATLEEVIDEPIARAMLVLGAPGLGKSRLTSELVHRIAERDDPIQVLTAQGEAHRSSSPFGLLAGALRRAAGIGDGEPIGAQRRKLEALAGRHVDGPNRRRIAAFLGEIANVEFPNDYFETLEVARRDVMVMGDAMRSAWLDWLSAELDHGAILLILEDLHHGDLPTVRFVGAALENLEDRPLMVLALANPSVKDRFPKLWSSVDPIEIQLRGLTKKATEKLVRQVLGDASGEMIDLILERGEGNPFYVEELVRAMAEGGQAVGELPDTVIGMVQARLDALGPQAKRVLRAASVFGNRFWRGGTVALLGGADSTSSITEWIDDLVEREIIQKSSISAFPDETEYQFRSTSVRDAAYAMLTDRDRSLGHRLAGQWLEANGERNATILARHFDLGSESSRAIGYYLASAQQAIEANDFEAAIAYAERGVALGAQMETLGRLELTRAIAHYWLGESDKTALAAERACLLLPQGSAPWFRAIGDLLSSLLRSGDTGTLEAHVERAATASPTEDAVDAQVICLARTAEHLLLLGHYDLSERLFARIAEVTATHEPEPLALARVHRGRARRALHHGDPGAYATGLEAAYSTFERGGDLRNACNERMNMGFAFAELGEYAKAKEALENARSAAERMNLEHVIAWADNNLGNVLALSDLAEAERVEQRAIDAGLGQKDARLEGTSRIYMSRILLDRGDVDGAIDQAERALVLLENLTSLLTVALASLGRALIRKGLPGVALERSTAAMRHLEKLGGLEEGEALVRLVYAEALGAAGKIDDARVAIATARDRLTERSARIEHPAWRQSFLERVPDHARTFELATAWNAESATIRD